MSTALEVKKVEIVNPKFKKIDAMQAGPYGLPTQEEADAAARKRILAGGI